MIPESELETLLSQLPDMEAISPDDRLSRLAAETAVTDSGGQALDPLNLCAARQMGHRFPG